MGDSAVDPDERSCAFVEAELSGVELAFPGARFALGIEHVLDTGSARRDVCPLDVELLRAST